MKLVKISCIVLMAFVLVGCSNKGEKLALTLENGYYPKTTDVYIEASPAMREFLDMQNEITETLRVKDNRYIYSRESIEKIIENFDFSKINLESEYEYTNEGFLEAILKSLDETVLSK